MNKRKLLIFITFVMVLLFSQPIMAKIIIDKHPEIQYTRVGGYVNYTIKAHYSGKRSSKANKLTYQWQVNNPSRKVWVNVANQTRKNIVIKANYSDYKNYYRCAVKDGVGNVKYTKSAKLVLTDVWKKYSYQLNDDPYSGMFKPKVADGYCYIYCHDDTYSKYVKQAIDKLNSLYKRTFIYTETGCIADIVFFDFDNCSCVNNIWFRGGEIDAINYGGFSWAGVTFADPENDFNYIVGLNKGYLSEGSIKLTRAVIIHELGHCIGLSHSKNKKSIMNAYVSESGKMTKSDINNFVRQIKKIKKCGRGYSSTVEVKSYTCHMSRR